MWWWHSWWQRLGGSNDNGGGGGWGGGNSLIVVKVFWAFYSVQLIWACDVYLGPWFRLHLHWLRSVVHRSTSPQKHRLSIPSECLSLCLPAACSPSLSVCLYTFHSLCLYVCQSVSMTV